MRLARGRQHRLIAPQTLYPGKGRGFEGGGEFPRRAARRLRHPARRPSGDRRCYVPHYDLLRPLHHRMAVILPSREYDLWLDLSVQESDRLQPLLHPYPAEEMIAFPVSSLVNNPANESRRCIEPLTRHF